MTPQQEDAVGLCLQSVGRRYVRYINDVYGRTGTLWEGRYKASLIETETYLLTCYRYIELNPVRAAMVSHPGEYCWSSHVHNAAGEENAVLRPHLAYLQRGATPAERQHAYRELFRHKLDSTTLHVLREALNHEQITGSERFKDQIEAMLNRRVRPGIAGRPRRDGVGEEAGEYIAY
jgi:putative transposase